MVRKMSYKLNESEIKRLQQKSLEMYLFFKDFCEKNDLTYFFCGGCLIGAIREKGFIPWDDDIDIFMPREDYERLIEIFNEKSGVDRYFLQVSEKDKLTKNLFATICDSETTFIKTYQSDLDINHGIVLDILPIDGCPSSKVKRLFQIVNALFYSLYLIGEAPENNGKIIYLAGKFLLGLVPFKSLRWKIAMSAKRKMTKYSIKDCEYTTELCSGHYYMKKRYLSADFEKAVYLDFEGLKIPAPVGYNDYLSKAFGDYMTLPPESERVCHHELEFVDTDNSYKIYKGKYYFYGGKNK